MRASLFILRSIMLDIPYEQMADQEKDKEKIQ